MKNTKKGQKRPFLTVVQLYTKTEMTGFSFLKTKTGDLTRNGDSVKLNS